MDLKHSMRKAEKFQETEGNKNRVNLIRIKLISFLVVTSISARLKIYLEFESSSSKNRRRLHARQEAN